MKLPSLFRKPAEIVTSVRAALTPNSSDSPQDAKYWRKIGQRSSRNLRDLDFRLMVEQCSKASQVDGLGRSHVRLVSSITVGANEVDPRIECADEKARETLQQLLDGFWKDPVNDLSASLPEFMDGLTTTGSLCLPLVSGEASRATRVAYLDPVTFVAPGVLTDPGNVRQPIAVLRRGWIGNEVIAHPIIRYDDSLPDLFASAPRGSTVTIDRAEQFGGKLTVKVGDPCMYLGINRTCPNQSAGISDLYPALDLLGAIDELVFGSVRRSINIGAYALAVYFPVGTPKAVMDAQMTAIRSDLESGEGRSIGLTKDVEVKPISADLKSGEWSSMERMARTDALIALGPWPIHVFSDGGTTNVATAAEQGSSMANILLARQNAFRKLIVRMCWYALRKYPEAQQLLAANPDVKILLPLPTIAAKDTTRESNVLMVETNALATAVAEGFCDLPSAQREWRESAVRYGWNFTQSDAPDAETFLADKANALQVPALSLSPDVPTPPASKPTEGTPKAAAA